MYRRRQVRFAYPGSIVRSALAELATDRAKDVAKRWNVPLTTVYRWRSEYARGGGSKRLPPEPAKRASDLAVDERVCNTADINRSRAYAVPSQRRSRDALQRLRLARKAIEEKYNVLGSSNQIAHVAGLSRYHFIRSYKRIFGETPQAHLSRVRVEHAVFLLRTTLEPAGNIATVVGYDSYASLSKAFVRVKGLSVADYCRNFVYADGVAAIAGRAGK